jgi:quercetin dioxygenase-like cupin family protein
MAGLDIKTLDTPDETRQFVDKGRADVVDLDGTSVLKGTFEPGWKWSEHVKPIAQTDSCQAPHLLYVLSGRMKIVMEDGTEGEIGPGDAAHIAPGHDAWTVGDEACVAVDFGGSSNYAKRQ